MARGRKLKGYPHLSMTPGVRSGKPCIAGTRVAVVNVALANEQGIRPEDLLTHFPSRRLTLGEIHMALTYHYDHPEELEEHRKEAASHERGGGGTGDREEKG